MGRTEAEKGSLAEKLASETRNCPGCGLVVDNPFIQICPRCNSPLPAIRVDCEGCVHKILCPIGKNSKFKP